MPYNLSSPNGIVEPCDLTDLEGWFARELTQVPNPAERNVLKIVADDLDSFVRWASEAILLWPGCDRVPPPGKKQKYFSFPMHIRQMAKSLGVQLDTRPNGPAIAAFLLAGGTRPERFGSSNAWSIHHLYSGKFPYFRRDETTYAAKECKHFTQSAGLVAAHPVADALVDEFPFFAWLLRAEAYRRFGYDPDSAFPRDHDDYGFVAGRHCRVIEGARVDGAAAEPGAGATRSR
jgi:hypothetical protein